MKKIISPSIFIIFECIIINIIDVRNNVCYNKCGGDIMSYTTNITNARKDLYKLAEMAIENGVEININTKNGNVIMISIEKVA